MKYIIVSFIKGQSLSLLILVAFVCTLLSCKSRSNTQRNDSKQQSQINDERDSLGEESYLHKNGGEIQDDSLVLGIDVSKYQGRVEWQDLSLPSNCVAGSVNGTDVKCREGNLPVRFAFIKATKSNCVVDDFFQTNFDEAKRNGLIRGAYHFLVDSVSGAKQAEFFLSVAKLEKGDLPPVLDIEKDQKNGNAIELKASVEEWRKIAREWLDVVERHLGGVKAIVYTNLDGYDCWIKDDEILRNHDLWIAKPRGKRSELPEWVFLQFTHKGHARGITENEVDLNLFNGTADDLRGYVEEKGITK